MTIFGTFWHTSCSKKGGEFLTLKGAISKGRDVGMLRPGSGDPGMETMHTAGTRSPGTTEHLFGAAILFGLFAVYLAGLCPSIYWKDSSEFQAVAFALGIAHPAGSPAYIPLAKLMAMLPFGSIAVRVNLLSAFFGAVTACGLFHLILTVSRALWPNRPRPDRPGMVAAASVSLVAGLSPSLWQFSEVAEVYTLQSAVFTLLLLLLFRWGELNGPRRLLIAAAFLFGLSGGVHALMILFTPALVFYWIARGRRQDRSPATFALLVAALILGASVYLYLPVRASAGPAFNWGDPDTLERFTNHVLDRKDNPLTTAAAESFSNDAATVLRRYGSNLRSELGLSGLACSLLGFALFWKRPVLALTTCLLFIFHSGFYIRGRWWLSFGLIPTVVVASLWGGCGLSWVAARLSDVVKKGALPVIMRKALVTAFAACLILVLISSAIFNDATMRDYYTTHRLVGHALTDLPQDSVLISGLFWFFMSYLQHAEGVRPDVSVFNINEIRYTGLFGDLTGRRVSALTLPTSEPGDGRLFEFIDANIDARPIFWQPNSSDALIGPLAVPWGMLYQLRRDRSEVVSDETLARHRTALVDFLEPEFESERFWRDGFGLQFLATMLFYHAKTLDMNRHPLHALHYMKLASELNEKSGMWDQYIYMNEVGLLYRRLGRLEEAFGIFEHALAERPGELVSVLNIGTVHYDLGDYEEAKRRFLEAVSIDGTCADARYDLALAHEALGEVDPARAEYGAVIELAAGSPLAERAQTRLREVGGR